MIALGALERYAKGPLARPAGPRCEICGDARDGGEHPHVADVERRAILCACRGCATAFTGASTGSLVTVPTRVAFDPELALSDQRWAALGVPVRLAFVFRSSAAGAWVAAYPSPAGATEAEVDAEEWKRLAAESPLVADLAADVEAILVRGERGRPLEALLVPIDACYALVAIVRELWKGFDGGDPVRAALDRFFGELRARARPVRRTA